MPHNPPTLWQRLSRGGYLYLLPCLLLSLLSCVALLSLGLFGRLEYGGVFGVMKPVLTQAFAAALGVAGALLLSRMDYRLLARKWPWHMALCWALVALTFIPGIGYEPPGTGSRSWIALPLGMSFQPTELAKISLILSLAWHIQWIFRRRQQQEALPQQAQGRFFRLRAKNPVNSLRTLPLLLAHIGLPALIVHFQGDDGTAMVFLAIGLVVLVAAGLNRWVVAGGVLALGAAAPFIWSRLLSAHQRQRILGLLNPEPYAETIMYQQLQAGQAIAGGGLVGKGFFQPDHTYVPRSENDFIFSYIAESWGFLGGLLVLALLGLLLLATLRAAHRAADRCGTWLCTGVFALLIFQTLVNAGMNLMLLPVMGITLPFLSAGGTSSLTLYLCVGLVMSVIRRSAPAPAQTAVQTPEPTQAPAQEEPAPAEAGPAQ